jgi:hypothetical protein
VLLTTIDLRGFCSSEFPEGVDEKSRAWTFRNSPPKRPRGNIGYSRKKERGASRLHLVGCNS